VPREGDKKLHFNIPVVRGKQRFRELIIYVSKKCEADPYFGAIKLNKILYYSDFNAYRSLGQPITGMAYFRLKLGPAPQALLPVRRELIAERAIELQTVLIGRYWQDRTIALRDPVLSYFEPDEMAVVDGVIDDLWSQNATEVSDASHDVRWRTLRDRDLMPYEFAFLDGEVSEEDIALTEKLAQELEW
jgi:hypothetical protein